MVDHPGSHAKGGTSNRLRAEKAKAGKLSSSRNSGVKRPQVTARPPAKKK